MPVFRVEKNKDFTVMSMSGVVPAQVQALTVQALYPGSLTTAVTDGVLDDLVQMAFVVSVRMYRRIRQSQVI